MLERLLENWLDSASERSYQIAFTQMLIDDGFTIIHSTRHAQIEHGKDVIALDRDQNIHAFQLKGLYGKRLSKSALSDILPQLIELVSAKIEHPSVDTHMWHQSHLVINGDLEEEASDLLTKTNAGFVAMGYPERQLKTIVRGELLDRARRLSNRLLPQELRNHRLLLELYLDDGKGMLPKDKFSELITGSLPCIVGENGSQKVKEFVRTVTSLALINAIALSSFSNRRNYYAEIEAWVLYLSHVFACIEKHALPRKSWTEAVVAIEQHIYFLLKNLVMELSENPRGIEGDAMTEPFFYKARMTLLCALVSVFACWSMARADSGDLLEFCRSFVLDSYKHLHLWGEGAIPQVISLYWFLKKIDATPKPDFLISTFLEAICKLNAQDSGKAIPNPYYDVEATVLSNSGDPKYLIEDTFNEHSFTAESLMHLFVRQNWKQHTKFIWPRYTKLMQCVVEFEEPWRRFLWRNPDAGRNQSIWPKKTKQWDELKIEALECEGNRLPLLFKEYPAFSTLFLIVYPHRCQSDAVRWLDSYWKATR